MSFLLLINNVSKIFFTRYFLYMSRNYKFLNPEGMYFISFATVFWIDVFIREPYFDAIVESLDFCRKKKGMEIFSWCIMPSHIHMIFRARDKNPGDLIRDLKTFTSKKIQHMISDNSGESRKEWILRMMQEAGEKNSNVKYRQFWQQHNHPIELWSAGVIDQKVNYIHNNPVKAGFVNEPHDWRYSSAIDYSGGKGVLEIDFV